MIKHAIVRTPAPTLTDGITTATLGKPNYELALIQHAAYVEALSACGVDVHILEPDPAFPDSCFVEDTAVLTGRAAILTNPGAPTRKGEEKRVAEALAQFYPPDRIERIYAPGTLEGGDVLRVGDHFYTGISQRTNPDGARQFITLLQKHGYTGSTVSLQHVLHLKTGLAYLEEGILLAAGEFIGHPAFAAFKTIPIDESDAYAANCIRVNQAVLVPAGYPAVRQKIEAAGLNALEVDTSEFRKLDGGLSCLSLRF